MPQPGPNGANRQRIDFQQSDLRWVTRKEKSHGSFRLEAVLRLWQDHSASPTVWAFGTAVLAGNMYVDAGLVKSPPYMFQVAAGVLASSSIALADLLPYFVHANRLDAVEFSPDFPFPRHWSSRSAHAGTQCLSCTMQLLANDKPGNERPPLPQ